MIYKGPEVSTYWGDEEYSNRKAVVMKDDNGFYVEFYKEEKLWERRNVYDHSEVYAENAAENFVMGIIQ
jgi:hypothetical protein